MENTLAATSNAWDIAWDSWLQPGPAPPVASRRKWANGRSFSLCLPNKTNIKKNRSTYWAQMPKDLPFFSLSVKDSVKKLPAALLYAAISLSQIRVLSYTTSWSLYPQKLLWPWMCFTYMSHSTDTDHIKIKTENSEYVLKYILNMHLFFILSKMQRLLEAVLFFIF